MGTYRILLLVLGLLSLSSAQQDASQLYKLEGNVVNSLDGNPVPRALVQFAGRAELTGPEGEFSFDGVPAGKIQVMVTKPGYFRPGAKMRNWQPGSIVDIGPETGKVVLKLSPEAVIFGTVTGKDEEPLEGVGIQVLNFISVNGREQLAPARAGARTDEDGNFHVAGLPAGRYYIAIRAGDLASRVLGGQTTTDKDHYPPVVYYPGTTDLEAATPLDLAPGQRTEADFSLAVAPAFKLAGRVVAAGEWKQIYPPLIIDPLDQVLYSPDEFDPESGSFEFRAVPAGTYIVRISGQDQRNRTTFSRHKLTISRPVADARLFLRPGADIPVIVRTEFNKTKLPGSCAFTDNGKLQLSDCSDYPAAHVDLIAADSFRSQFGTEYGPVKDQAAFGLHGVPPGKYLVRAQPRFGGYVRSLRSGNVNLLREELVVPEDGTVPPIEVVLSDDSGTVNVRVRAEKPGQQSVVLVFPEDALLSEPKIMRSFASNSEVQSGPLAPGRYRIFAFDSITGLDYANPDTLARYQSKAASVTVSPNGSASVTVDVIHTGD
jgi:hypothetical protein